MALHPCPHCGKIVSDKAPACPHCGAPVTPNAAPMQGYTRQYAPQRKNKNNTALWIALVAAALVIAVLVTYILVSGGKKDKEETTTTITTNNQEDKEREPVIEETSGTRMANNFNDDFPRTYQRFRGSAVGSSVEVTFRSTGEVMDGWDVEGTYTNLTAHDTMTLTGSATQTPDGWSITMSGWAYGDQTEYTFFLNWMPNGTCNGEAIGDNGYRFKIALKKI